MVRFYFSIRCILPETLRENLFDILFRKASNSHTFASAVFSQYRTMLHRLSPSDKERLLEILLNYPYSNQNLENIISMFSSSLDKFSESTKERIAKVFPNYTDLIYIPEDYNKLSDSSREKKFDKWIIDIEQNENEQVAKSILISIRNKHDKLPKPIKKRLLEIIFEKIENKALST